MTAKKKHLIELMIEAGVKWPEGAEYAAQDKHNLKVNFFEGGRPEKTKYDSEWMANDCDYMKDFGVELKSVCNNWHQTIVTREQYEKALADAKSSKEEDSLPQDEDGNIEYPVKKTIEQLAAEYSVKADEAQRLKSVADEALKLADDALYALEKAGEAIGLVISIDAKTGKLEITDWRYLRLGDVIEYVGGTVDDYSGMQGSVSNFDEKDAIYPIEVMFDNGARKWCREWRFIRRP